MKTGLGSDFVVREVVTVNVLRVPILRPLEERPGVVYHASVYTIHGEGPTIPSLFINGNGVD